MQAGAAATQPSDEGDRESLLQSLGWQVMDGVSTQLGKIDRDKTKHHHTKTSPSYNGRKKAIRVEKKTRTAADPELIARAAAQKQKRVRSSGTTTVLRSSCCTRRRAGRQEEATQMQLPYRLQL